MSSDSDRTHQLAHLDTDGLTAQLTSARLYAARAEDTGDVSTSAALATLRVLGGLRDELDHIELRMTESLLDAGQTWDQVAAATGRTSRQAAQQRYRRLGGSRSWPTRRPATGYAPVDITPPELSRAALAETVPAWAEAAADPTEVTDWDRRQNQALIPFSVDEHGWPQHPGGRTGRTGRNLGKWGENAAADPIVIAGHGANRHVLLIARSDGAGWAIPGGMVDAGETAPAALVRELAEETGVDLREHTPTVLTRQLVDDWRASDHAWVATTAALYQLPEQVPATAGDDATAAHWFPAPDLPQLDAAVQAAGGTLYDAHRDLLALALDHLDQQH